MFKKMILSRNIKIIIGRYIIYILLKCLNLKWLHKNIYIEKKHKNISYWKKKKKLIIRKLLYNIILFIEKLRVRFVGKKGNDKSQMIK